MASIFTPKCTIKKNVKKYNEFKVTLTLTQGEILSVKHALEQHPESPVGQDVLAYLNNAMDNAGLVDSCPAKSAHYHNIADQIAAVENDQVIQR